jgi:hypothetical protein
MAKPTKGKRKPSRAQLEQRQLSWLLRITRGAEANILSALTTNSNAISQYAYAHANRAAQALSQAAEVLRGELHEISK